MHGGTQLLGLRLLARRHAAENELLSGQPWTALLTPTPGAHTRRPHQAPTVFSPGTEVGVRAPLAAPIEADPRSLP